MEVVIYLKLLLVLVVNHAHMVQHLMQKEQIVGKLILHHHLIEHFVMVSFFLMVSVISVLMVHLLILQGLNVFLLLIKCVELIKSSTLGVIVKSVHMGLTQTLIRLPVFLDIHRKFL